LAFPEIIKNQKNRILSHYKTISNEVFSLLEI